MGCNGKSSTNSKGCIRPALKSLKGPHVEYRIGDALSDPHGTMHRDAWQGQDEENTKGKAKDEGTNQQR